MIDDIENNEEEKRKKGETEGEGEGDGRSGRGRVGGGTGTGEAAAGSRSSIAFSVDASKLKEIMANWRQLDLGETVSAVVEFFSDGITRASANLSVDWPKAANLKNAGFALMNRFDSFGKDMTRAMRQRTREATGLCPKKIWHEFQGQARVVRQLSLRTRIRVVDMATEFEAASDASTKRFVVTVPEGNGYSEPSTIGRIVDHFRQLSINADFEMKDSIAVKNTDGSYTLITRGP